MLKKIIENLEFKEIIKRKLIIIFGAGKAGQAVARKISVFSNIKLYFVDNDQSKWGKKIDEIQIKSPNILVKIPKENMIILIASMYHQEISLQLKDMGFEEKKHFWNGLDIINLCETSQKKISETSKVKESLVKYCVGDGLDIGFGGDPITDTAICLDLPERYASYNNSPQHLHGDATNLIWFQDECLDYVYSSHVLEDFDDTEKVLNEWLRVIKVGGVLVLFLPDEQAYREYCYKLQKQPNANHIHENFSLNYVKNILSKRNDVEIIYEKNPSNIYSFELVIRKIQNNS